jgi:hypothetical protein
MFKNPVKRSKKTKAAEITALLLRRNGATIAEIAKSTDWQSHSERGFISGTLKKKLGLAVTSQVEDGKPRRYFLVRGVS